MRIGLSEVILVAIVALALVKPDKLAEYAGSVGKALKSFSEKRDGVVEPIREAVQPVADVQEEMNETLREAGKLMKGEK